MGRKTWVKPMTLVQKFEANEAVAATTCFQIACQSDTKAGMLDTIKGKTNHPADLDGWPWTQGESFHSDIVFGKHDGCREAPNNIFNFDGTTLTFIGDSGEVDNGKIDAVIDANHDGIKGNSGDRVYWHTWGTKPVNREFVWNHWGEIKIVDSSRPLHS